VRITVRVRPGERVGCAVGRALVRAALAAVGGRLRRLLPVLAFALLMVVFALFPWFAFADPVVVSVADDSLVPTDVAGAVPWVSTAITLLVLIWRIASFLDRAMERLAALPAQLHGCAPTLVIRMEHVQVPYAVDVDPDADEPEGRQTTAEEPGRPPKPATRRRTSAN
jgi:hypothetical protein